MSQKINSFEDQEKAEQIIRLFSILGDKDKAKVLGRLSTDKGGSPMDMEVKL